MARLNEPPAPTDSHFELLRRKFLRQNRDIAKINSDQSQKIRRLENDCARLLSENLDLRGQILRLEKQAEDNTARRIADHALEVRAKLEEQLSEFASLLGSLGVEPPAKRRSSEERAFAKHRQSNARSPAQRKRRNTEVDADLLAEQEGRLPPIYENRTYQRATMNAEILALCAAAEDANDSPDLGPPPVSRFVEENPVDYGSPMRIDVDTVPESPPTFQKLSPPPILDFDRMPPASPEPKKEMDEITVQEGASDNEAVSATKSAPATGSHSIRAGAKRKYGDENATAQTATTGTGKENTTSQSQKLLPARGTQKRRSIREVPAVRRERVGPLRTPLGVKSTNADVSSPRKAMKDATPGGVQKEPARGPKGRSVTAEGRVHRSPLKVEIPPPEPSATIDVVLEPKTPLLSAMPSSPATPNRPTQQEIPHDTPPPSDISFNGETSRPSRRARSAVSYAEPNLRDKMRRPTKELLDAVTGEGKFVRTGSATKLDDRHSGPTSVTKTGSSASSSSKITPAGDLTKVQQHTIMSPLAQKDVFPDTLPNTVVMERRRRPSAMGISSRESLAALERPESTSREPSPAIEPAAATEQTSRKPKSGADNSEQQAPPPTKPAARDIYDFSACSPASEVSTCEPKPAAVPTTGARPRTTRKSSMAAAAALRELLDDEAEDQDGPAPPKPRARKRASMLAPKKSSLLGNIEEDEAADISATSASSGDVGGGGRDRISRRRSMML